MRAPFFNVGSLAWYKTGTGVDRKVLVVDRRVTGRTTSYQCDWYGKRFWCVEADLLSRYEPATKDFIYKYRKAYTS